MPKLSNMSIENTPQSAIIYGPPKAGKTLLAGHLAKHFKLIWIDIENGISTLFQLPKEWQENIDVIQILDTKDNPQAITTSLKLLEGLKVKICDEHSRMGCGKCITKPVGQGITLYEFNELPSDHIVVLDSFTQLTSSANGKATEKLDPTKGQHEEFSHWRIQGALLEKALDLMQNARFNVVVIAHEAGIDQVDKSEKIVPAGGTKNFARTVAKYFGHIVHIGLKNKKHIATSASTANGQILTGSRTNFEVDLNDPDSISRIFKDIPKKAISKLAK